MISRWGVFKTGVGKGGCRGGEGMGEGYQTPTMRVILGFNPSGAEDIFSKIFCLFRPFL
jgi:hypothetical protein